MLLFITAASELVSRNAVALIYLVIGMICKNVSNLSYYYSSYTSYVLVCLRNYFGGFVERGVMSFITVRLSGVHLEGARF